MTTPRRPYRLPSTVRKALIDTRNFLKDLNTRSDEIANQMPRCLQAQEHYNKAKEIIASIDKILIIQEIDEMLE